MSQNNYFSSEFGSVVLTQAITPQSAPNQAVSKLYVDDIQIALQADIQAKDLVIDEKIGTFRDGELDILLSDTRNDTETALRGGASADYDTLKKVEDKLVQTNLDIVNESALIKSDLRGQATIEYNTLEKIEGKLVSVNSVLNGGIPSFEYLYIGNHWRIKAATDGSRLNFEHSVSGQRDGVWTVGIPFIFHA